MGKKEIKLRKEKEEADKILVRELVTARKADKEIQIRRENVDLSLIKKELEIFYKFLDKFVAYLDKSYFPTSGPIEDDTNAIMRPQISAQVRDDFTKLPEMSELEIYNSELLQYAVHFNTEISKYSYVLENKVDELFIGRNDQMILTPASSFDIVTKYNEDGHASHKTQIRAYLSNMQKMSNRLNEQIDYDVITFILKKDENDVSHVQQKKKEILEFYASVSKAKKAIKEFTDDKSGVVDTIVDTAANEFRNAQHKFTNKSEDSEFAGPEDFIEKNKELLKMVSSNVTNAFGNKLADGAINADDFANVANSMVSNLGRKDRRAADKLGKLDMNKLREIQMKHKGDFSKAVDINKVFDDVLRNMGKQ